ncbi:MAG: hypothetical protein ACRDX8_15120, partial [Acidimicrobiales bacterium]
MVTPVVEVTTAPLTSVEVNVRVQFEVWVDGTTTEKAPVLESKVTATLFKPQPDTVTVLVSCGVVTIPETIPPTPIELVFRVTEPAVSGAGVLAATVMASRVLVATAEVPPNTVALA